MNQPIESKRYQYPECMFMRERETTEDGKDVYIASLASKVIPKGEKESVAVVLAISYDYGEINIDAETDLSETFHGICVKVRRGEIIPDDYEEADDVNIDILDKGDRLT